MSDSRHAELQQPFTNPSAVHDLSQQEVEHDGRVALLSDSLGQALGKHRHRHLARKDQGVGNRSARQGQKNRHLGKQEDEHHPKQYGNLY